MGAKLASMQVQVCFTTAPGCAADAPAFMFTKFPKDCCTYLHFPSPEFGLAYAQTNKNRALHLHSTTSQCFFISHSFAALNTISEVLSNDLIQILFISFLLGFHSIHQPLLKSNEQNILCV